MRKGRPAAPSDKGNSVEVAGRTKLRSALIGSTPKSPFCETTRKKRRAQLPYTPRSHLAEGERTCDFGPAPPMMHEEGPPARMKTGSPPRLN